MPARSAQSQQALAGSLQDYLASHLNASVQVEGVSDYYSIVDGFSAGVVHAALVNTMGYVAAHKWGGAEAVLTMAFRSGRADYAGKIIVRGDGPVKKPQDLNGKRFAFHDRYSTAGYLLPLSYLRSRGLKPAVMTHMSSYRDIVMAVYKGEADAGAIYFDDPDGNKIRDARGEILAEHPDAGDKLIILDETGRIAGSPFAIARSLKDSLFERLASAMADYARTKEGAALLLQTYDATALVPATDREYDSVRQSLERAGLSEEDLVPGGYKLKIQEHLWNTSQTAP